MKVIQKKNIRFILIQTNPTQSRIVGVKFVNPTQSRIVEVKFEYEQI